MRLKRLSLVQIMLLVLGLPGAGKSETLVCCILVLALLEKRRLITSHTHNAVNNILKRLPSKGCEDFIRIGDDEFKFSREVRRYRLGGRKLGILARLMR